MNYKGAIYIMFSLFLFISCYSKGKKAIEEKEIILEEYPVYTKPYDELKAETLDKRTEYRKVYNSVAKNKQDSVITDAQMYLQEKADEFFRAWYDTPWTFEGHTQVPKQGTIACGYFITTTLRDMGFNVPRIYWAQQGAEYVVKKLSPDVRRFYDVPMQEIVEYIEEKGEGLYIVGLDCHVGYIYYHNGKKNFVHPNYYRKSIGVMSEPLIGHNPLNDSKLRVIGKIFDKEMTKNWILNNKYVK